MKIPVTFSRICRLGPADLTLLFRLTAVVTASILRWMRSLLYIRALRWGWLAPAFDCAGCRHSAFLYLANPECCWLFLMRLTPRRHS